MARWAVPLFVLLVALPLSAQDRVQWEEACRALEEALERGGSKTRAEAVARVGDATYPDVDRKTAMVIIAVIDAELKRSEGGTREYRVSEPVLMACTDALRKIQDRDAIKFMVEAAAGGADPRRGYYVVRALAGSSAGDLTEELTELTEHSNMAVRIAALDALAEEARPGSFELFIRALEREENPWQVKAAAVKGIKAQLKPGDTERIGRLLDAMGKLTDEEIRVKSDIKDFLNRLLGLNVQSYDPNAWRSAIAQKKEEKKAPAAPAKDGVPAKAPEGKAHKTVVSEFFGIKTESNRIIFVLDRTGSMADPCSDAPDEEKKKREGVATGDKHKSYRSRKDHKEAKEIKKRYDDREIQIKMDALRREYINTVYNLPESVFFTTVWYNTSTEVWSEKLVPATWANKKAAMENAETLQPEGGTNIWGALEAAFKIAGEGRRPAPPPDRPPVKTGKSHAVPGKASPDTFYLLTDGRHNNGRFANILGQCDKKSFLAELEKLNRLRQIRIHTICLGDPGEGVDPPDPDFLRQLAEQNDGQFRHVSAKAKD
ncbi:MAG: vWA domain-containing protein [Planctomycetota bacterium]